MPFDIRGLYTLLTCLDRGWKQGDAMPVGNESTRENVWLL